MLVGSTDKPTVFIMGAGATRGAMTHVLVNRKRIRPPLNSDFFQVAETFGRANGGNSEQAKRFRRVWRVLKDDLRIAGTPAMEEAFNLLSLARDLPEVFPARRGRRPAAGRGSEVVDFLRLAFGVFTALDRGPSQTTGYHRLCGMLGPNDTIITLNYDTVLDSALVDHGWDPRDGYCLTGGRRKVKWHPCTSPREPSVAGVQLLKLHGSLNWFVRGSFTQLSKVFSSKPTKVTPPRKNGLSGHIRQIVPPIYSKFFGHSHWGSLWGQAYEALKASEMLVVIGCSLVDSDFHLRALLRCSAQWRKRRNARYRSIALVDRVKVRRKWRGVLRGLTSNTHEHVSFAAFLSSHGV